MGEAKRRKALGHLPSAAQATGGGNSSPAHHLNRELASSLAPSPRGIDVPLTFAEALDLTTREGATCWTWVPRRRKGRTVGADTYISYLDDSEEGYGDREGTGEAWVSIEGDDWDTPDVGEVDDSSMEELEGDARDSVWYRTSRNRYDLPDFSFHKLRDLGCTDPEVLEQARAYDAAW